MKKVLLSLFFILATEALFSQKCEPAFNITFPVTKYFIPFTEPLFYGINYKGINVLDYSSGKIVSKLTFKELGIKVHSFIGAVINQGIVFDIKHGNNILIGENGAAAINLKAQTIVWELNNFSNVVDYYICDDYLLLLEKIKPNYPLTCIDLKTGTIGWKKENADDELSLISVDYFDENKFLMGFEPQKTDKQNHKFTIFSASSGMPSSTFNLKCKEAFPVCSSGKSVYIMVDDSAGANLKKIDPENKQLEWIHLVTIPFYRADIKKSDFDFRFRTKPVLDIETHDGRVFITSSYGLEILDEKSGERVFRKTLSAGIGFDRVKTWLSGDFAYMTSLVITHVNLMKNTSNYILKKVKVADSAEIWTTNLGYPGVINLTEIHKTRFGLLVQWGGEIHKTDLRNSSSKTTQSLLPGCSFTMIDSTSGKILWTFDEPKLLLNDVHFENDTMTLFTNKLIKTISLADGKEISNMPCSIFYENCYIDYKRRIIINYQSQTSKIIGYRY